MRKFLFPLVPLFLLACGRDPAASLVPDTPLLAEAPADGNGNKVVIPIDAQFPDIVTCEGGATLDLHVVGWVQVRDFSQHGNRNVEVDDINVVITYSNAAGETFAWREVGADHFYVDGNGDLIHVIIGRDGFDGIMGRLVINTTTGEVTFVTGPQKATRDERACAALT